MASPPNKPKTTSSKPKANAPSVPNAAKLTTTKIGLKATLIGAVAALKAYFTKANGYEITAMVLFAGVLGALMFAKPQPGMLPTALRILALTTTMAAKFMSNAGLSANPGTAQDQATAKRLSLLMDAVALVLTGISFFVH